MQISRENGRLPEIDLILSDLNFFLIIVNQVFN